MGSSRHSSPQHGSAPPVPAPLSLERLGVPNWEPSNIQGHEPAGPQGRRPFGYSGVQGVRRHMEDELILGAHIGGGWHCWGILDGHGGKRASRWLVEALPEALRQVWASGNERENELDDMPVHRVGEALELLDEQLLADAKADGWDDGSTALLVLLRGKHLITIQVGDSNVALCGDKRACEHLCSLHRPTEMSEANRLSAAAVHVQHGKVLGLLAVSRTFGDFECKQVASDGVIASPEVATHELSSCDELLILGCDGLWDVLSAEDAWAIVRCGWQRSEVLDEKAGGACDLRAAASGLTAEALVRGSRDNVSVVLIKLR